MKRTLKDWKMIMEEIRLKVGDFSVDVPNYFSPGLVLTKMFVGPQRIEQSTVEYALNVLDMVVRDRGDLSFWLLSPASRRNLAAVWVDKSNDAMAMGGEEPDIVY
jgi:hypothetical protein